MLTVSVSMRQSWEADLSRPFRALSSWVVQQERVLLVLGNAMKDFGGSGASLPSFLFVPTLRTLRENPRRPVYDTCSKSSVIKALFGAGST